MEIPTYVPCKVSFTIEANGRVTTYTFPNVGTVTLDVREYPLADISFDTLTAIKSTRGIKSVTFELTDILRDENQTQLIVEVQNKETQWMKKN